MMVEETVHRRFLPRSPLQRQRKRNEENVEQTSEGLWAQDESSHALYLVHLDEAVMGLP